MKTLLATIAILFVFACEESDPPIGDVDFRHEMRNFVIDLSVWSKAQKQDFIIIPQNGQELITDTGDGDGVPQTDYLNAIDATGREDMFFGYYLDDQATPEEDKQHLLGLCILCESHDVEVLATDYCSTPSNMDSSYTLNDQYDFASFAADQRDLNNIPNYPDPIDEENTDDILTISQARNFLYLINSEHYTEKSDFITAVAATNYDLILMDLYHNEVAYTAAEITALKMKSNGGTRLVVCYMSIGEAEDYRYYWNSDWTNNPPVWLDQEDPNWEGNYYVRYWDTGWKDVIYGNDNSYLKKILDAGFNGVYLDIIDGFEFFEER